MGKRKVDPEKLICQYRDIKANETCTMNPDGTRGEVREVESKVSPNGRPAVVCLKHEKELDWCGMMLTGRLGEMRMKEVE